MNKTLNIGLPINIQRLLETRLLIQAGSGGGKSYALRKTIESAAGHVQQIILDPEGEFVTLREKFDFALVSKDGDIPLSLKYAETLAHKILETGISVIIDLYELKHHERILFVKRFVDALVNAPKELWHDCLIYIDEAHIFCPESSKAESMSSVIDLCTRGRKRGYCAILATQRLSKLHKDAAAECLNKMIGRTGLDIDRKRAGEELGLIKKEEFLNLRELSPGEFFAFGPSISNEVIKFKVDPVITTHPKSGSRITAAPPTPKTIQKILEKLKDIPEEAARELETKQQLQAEVTKLRTMVTKLEKSAPIDESAIEKKFQEFYQKTLSDKTKLINELKADSKQKAEAITSVYKIVDNIYLRTAFTTNHAAAQSFGRSIQQVITESIPHPSIFPMALSQANHKQTTKNPQESIESGSLPKGDETVLKILAMHHPDSVTRRKAAILSRYSPTKSTFRNILSRLRQGGYLYDVGNNYLQITNDGLKVVGDYDPLPVDGESLINFWQGELGSGPFALLRYLFDKAQFVSREDLAAGTGYDIGKSTFRNMLSTIRSLGLIEEDKNLVKIAHDFFA